MPNYRQCNLKFNYYKLNSVYIITATDSAQKILNKMLKLKSDLLHEINVFTCCCL